MSKILKNEDNEQKKETSEDNNVMLYVDGSESSYHCFCGCNVFTRLSPLRYMCNSCKETYEGTK